MSVLRVYLNWVNSVLSDTGKQVEGIADLQKGEVLCQLLDTLNPGTTLCQTVTTGGEGTAVRYLDQVISYLGRHGVAVRLTSQDVCSGDVKSILDLLWTIILNFTIHNPKRRVEKRTIRNGKKLTLKWCCKHLPSGVWNLQKTVTNNLCSHENFSQLLQKFCGNLEPSKTQDKEEHLSQLLSLIESKYKIKAEIIKPRELLEGTIEEHDLLIYLSLLRWRIGDTVDSDSSSEESYLPDARLRGTTTTSRPDTSSIRTHVPVSAMLKGYALDDDSRHITVNMMSDRKNVTFSAENECQLGNGLTNNSQGKVRLSRPSSAPTSRFSLVEVNNTPKSNSGRFVRSFSPSRYAKSFDIPPDKKQELENRTVRINGQTSRILTPPLDTYFNDTNGLSEDTSDWLSSDMESQGVADKSLIKDTVNLKVKEVITGCDEKSSEYGKFKENELKKKSSESYSSLAGTNIPGLMSYHNGLPQNNFKIPIGGVPLFGMTPGAPVNSGIGGGVPLYLLPGHGPEVTRLFEALKRQQHVRETLADTTDGTGSLGDTSQFYTSTHLSEADYTENSNIGDETSSSAELNGKFEKSQSQDSSEAELKQFGESRTPSEDRLQSFCREPRPSDPQRFTDSGCESQSRPDSYNLGCKMEEDESLKKIRILRENLQKPADEEKLGDRSMGSDDLHMDDLSYGRKKNILPETPFTDTKTSQQRSHPTRHFSKLHMNERVDSGIKHDSQRFPRDQEPYDKDIVKQLTDEVKHLKSKVLTIERSQESLGDDSLREQERYRNSERSRLPRGPPRRSACESPPRSLLRSPEPRNLSSVEANRRARDTVNDLLVTMQTPLSRKMVEERKVTEQSRKDLCSRPLLSFHGFGRSLSEDRLHENKSRTENYHADDGWRSRSFHGGSDQQRGRGNYPEGRSRSLQDLSGRKIPTGILTDDELIVRPPSATPINYGYSSPIQKVSADIWGVDMKDMDNLEPGRQEKWKRLTDPKMFMSVSEIIELKQCLASATMENEILHAKVGNANLEIGEKMTKMAQVLEETKLSLIKTQAENEELRTQLNRERSRSDTLEVRVADLEAAANKARSECERLQNELEEARILLGGTNADGIHTVEQENYQLKRQLHLSQQDQKKTKQVLESMKVSRDRAHSAVRDLQTKLDDTREENHLLSREMNDVKTQERSYRKTATLLTRAADIKERFSNREDKIYQPNTEDTSKVQSYSPATPGHPYTTSTPYSKSKSSQPFMTTSPSRGHFIPRAASPTDISPVKEFPSKPKSYNYEEISPAVLSQYKEIYPHRKGRSAALRNRDTLHDSLTPGEERHRKWSVTGQLNYSDCDTGEFEAEKPYSESYIDSLPPHPDPLRDSQSSFTSRLREERNRNYTDEIENLKSHLSRSYHGEDLSSRQRNRSRDSSLQHSASMMDHAYNGKPGHDWDKRTPQGRPLSEVTPQRSYRASNRSPMRSTRPVRGILKPSSSDQDLRRIGRNSPPSRRSASPNVTFNTEVASRDISPQSTVSGYQIMGQLRGQTGSTGVPLFGVPSRRYGIVRNLNDEFEDEEPVRDCDSQQVQGFRAKNWFENKNSCDAHILTPDQRHYADLLIDKYLHGRASYLGSASPGV